MAVVVKVGVPLQPFLLKKFPPCTFVNDVRLKKHERVFGYHNGFADGKRA